MKLKKILTIVFISFMFTVSSCSTNKRHSNIDYMNGFSYEIIEKISDKYFEIVSKEKGYKILKLYHFFDNNNNLYIFKMEGPNNSLDGTYDGRVVKIGDYYFDDDEHFYVYIEEEDKVMLLLDAYNLNLISDKTLKTLHYRDYLGYPYYFMN